MDQGYERYALADSLFYDAPRPDESTDFEVAGRELPEGWLKDVGDEWTYYAAPASDLPAQGWKIHVSGCMESAAEAVEKAWEYCVANEVCFKHLRGPDTLFLRNAKYSPRGFSGKLVTVYPEDERQLELLIEELGELLDGLPGPYILSDLRIGAGPLYVRYGGFADRRCTDESGALVSAIEDGSGRLVPDRRDPVFSVPSWVTLPPFLQPHLTARGTATTADLPYRIDKALHFSNGGGVYQATDLRDERVVVLKEARPHAGLSSGGADAVTRLRLERDMLQRLADVDGVPEALDYFTVEGHEFLVQEFVEGRSFNSLFVERHPLTGPAPSTEEMASFTAWALTVLDSLERLVDELHAHGVVFHDLHMQNVMVRPDDTAALIDFEAAGLVEENGPQTMAAPGFLAPSDRRGIEVDRYNLACIRMNLLIPLTRLFVLDRAKAREHAAAAAEIYPIPPGFLDPAVREITRGSQARTVPALSPDPSHWPRTRAALERAILASATPHRDDRLFPGDVRQFTGEALGLSHGAAGVLYALDASGASRSPEHEEWLVKHACDPPSGVSLGLYDGLLGAAHVLAGFGHGSAAVTIAEICLGEKWERLGIDLSGGLSGWALTLDHLADVTGETGLRDAAARVAEVVSDRLDHEAGNPRPGLMFGASGPALMLMRRYERTGDKALLEQAAAALRRDLAECVVDRHGALQVDEGYRRLPYIWRGSVGIGMALEEYLALRPDGPGADEFATALAQIRLAARSRFYVLPSLFNGRAGMVLFLSRHEAERPTVERHIRELAWHTLEYEDGVAFPGEQLYRLSMDLRTGTAGVLLALAAALGDRPVHLPFFTTAHKLPAEASAGDTPIQPERG